MAVPAREFWGVRGVHTRPNTGDMHEIGTTRKAG